MFQLVKRYVAARPGSTSIGNPFSNSDSYFTSERMYDLESNLQSLSNEEHIPPIYDLHLKITSDELRRRKALKHTLCLAQVINGESTIVWYATDDYHRDTHIRWQLVYDLGCAKGFKSNQKMQSLYTIDQVHLTPGDYVSLLPENKLVKRRSNDAEQSIKNPSSSFIIENSQSTPIYFALESLIEREWVTCYVTKTPIQPRNTATISPNHSVILWFDEAPVKAETMMEGLPGGKDSIEILPILQGKILVLDQAGFHWSA